MPHAHARAYRDAIDMGGRLSVRYQRDGKEDAVHGSFSWTQAPDHTTVALLSPLGQTIATIDITPATASMIMAGQAPRIAADADTLAADTLGWPLPLAGLRDWLQGFTRDAQGNVHDVLAQSTLTTPDGWQISYTGQDDTAAGARHPKRIDLQRTTSQAGEVSIRIVIDNWQAR